jgi:lipopolysaccharide transport system permease protein
MTSQREESVREEVFGKAHVTEIDSRVRSLRTEMREIWAYRDLLALLIRRDVSVRYKQSVIGIAWAVLQPLALTLIFTIVFGLFAKLPSDGYPYAVFALCGLLPWLYFARALAGASDSIVGASNLVTKVYFPRLIIPMSKTVSGLIDFAISFAILLCLLAWYRIIPGPAIMLLPAFMVIAMLTAFAIGLWLTALNVKFRDVGLLVPFLTQIWMYASPIAYSAALVPERWRWIYSLNPIVCVVEGFRWAILGNAPPAMGPMFLSLATVLLILVTGIVHFRRTERYFADII